jgi:hypothetical protein
MSLPHFVPHLLNLLLLLRSKNPVDLSVSLLTKLLEALALLLAS